MIRRFFTRFVALLIILACALPQSADARGRHRDHRPRPRAHVSVTHPAPRPGDGWVWVGSRPGLHGWITGHWAHVGVPPRPGWVWVPGWWNGALWLTGFWRPATLVGYHWVEAGPGPEGTWVAGFWEPDGPTPEGMVWRPGYWTGTVWMPGHWVPVESYNIIGPDGQIAFFAVGDGHVEEVALPATQDVYDEQGALEDGPGVLQHAFEEPAGDPETHAPAP